MRFAFLRAGALLGSLLLLGCSVGQAADSLPPGTDTPNDEDEVDATLVIEGPAAIELSPGQRHTVSVVTYPPAGHGVYFALMGAPSDTSLDAAHVWTDAEGRAAVEVHAPSTPATFTLRAWIKNGPAAELSIAVSKQGKGAIEIVPDYDGKRPITEWVGSVVAGTTCAALAGQLPGEPKGSLVAVSPAQEHPLVQSVPVGPKLAVHVRAGHFAWGCADTHDISAGTKTKVKVHVVDVPAALDRTDLDVALTYAPAPGPYGKILDAARAEFLGAMLPPDKTEAEALLDAMVEVSFDPVALADARAAGGWDALAEAHFAQLQMPLADRMTSWIDKGLSTAPPVLTGRLVSVDDVPGKAFFLPSSIGGFDAASAGAPSVHLMSWTGAPDDKVFLSGDVYWLPSKLIGAACRAGADEDLGVLYTIDDTLAKAASCSDLAGVLGGSETCDAACLNDLCRAALGVKWQAAVDASAFAGAVGTIQIGASGMVKVDDIATPIAVTGTWLGTISDGTLSAQASGDIGGILAQTEVVPDPAGTPQ